jgi:hypothetical protein
VRIPIKQRSVPYIVPTASYITTMKNWYVPARVPLCQKIRIWGYPKYKSRVRETSSRVPERPPGTGTGTSLVPRGRRQVQRRRLAWPRAAKVLSCRPVCFVRTEGHECPDAWLHTALGWARPAWRPPGLPPVRLVRPVRRPRRPRRGRPPRCRNAKFTGLAKLGSPVQVGPIFLE